MNITLAFKSIYFPSKFTESANIVTFYYIYAIYITYIYIYIYIDILCKYMIKYMIRLESLSIYRKKGTQLEET